ncbi:hypothetical protein LZ32DRAFT_263760 [Colletotrichum eremochloae]|nr:hypothetical protein LZ32DRAFT_263760 [Colletotrichum eremochloae]
MQRSSQQHWRRLFSRRWPREMRCRDETRRRRRLAPVLWDQPCTPRCPSSRVAQQWAPSGLWRRYLFVPCTIGIAHNRFLYDLSNYCPRHGSRPAASAGSVLNSSSPCYESRLERPIDMFRSGNLPVFGSLVRIKTCSLHG